MKKIRIFMRTFSVFGGEVFNIFEQACFRNVSIIKVKLADDKFIPLSM